MTEGAAQTMDENTRRYYLDAMGIQCWQSFDSQRNLPVADGGDRDVAAASYAELEMSILACTKCALHETRKHVFAGRGKQSAVLMFVLLAPDESSGLVCSDEADALFGKMLAAININIDDVYITSLLKCSVPANHTVSPREIQSCSEHLKQQIEFIQPEVLVVLGETAVRCLLQKELSIDDGRAMNETMSQQLASVPLFFSYSPEELLQQPENKRKAWADLQQLQEIIEKK